MRQGLVFILFIIMTHIRQVALFVILTVIHVVKSSFTSSLGYARVTLRHLLKVETDLIGLSV